jgi:hypothetical protein
MAIKRIEPFVVEEDWTDSCVVVQCPCGNKATVGFDYGGGEDESECEECHRIYTASVSYAVHVEHNGEHVGRQGASS